MSLAHGYAMSQRPCRCRLHNELQGPRRTRLQPIHSAGEVLALHVAAVGDARLGHRREVAEARRGGQPNIEPRSEERRVGKECRSRWSRENEKKSSAKQHE